MNMKVSRHPILPDGTVLPYLSQCIHRPSQLPISDYALLSSLTSDCHIISQSAKYQYL
jgi:hypothetical protein